MVVVVGFCCGSRLMDVVAVGACCSVCLGDVACHVIDCGYLMA